MGDCAVVTHWLRRCLMCDDVAVLRADEAGRGSGCSVWDCDTLVEKSPVSVVLKVYRPGFDDYSGLGPVDTARKCALALREFPSHGVPTPCCLGMAVHRCEAAVASEKLMGERWIADTRPQAGRVLARLHSVPPADLGSELASLVERSTPNRRRVLNGVAGWAAELDAVRPKWRREYGDLWELVRWVVDQGEPPHEDTTLVHGDYWSVNLLAASDGIRVLDWDLLALGDPMWDLGFLLAADRDLGSDEADATLRAYGAVGPIAAERLVWHRRCWQAYHALRDLRQGGVIGG